MFSPPNLKGEVLDVLAPFSFISVATSTGASGDEITLWRRSLANPGGLWLETGKEYCTVQ